MKNNINTNLKNPPHKGISQGAPTPAIWEDASRWRKHRKDVLKASRSIIKWAGLSRVRARQQGEFQADGAEQLHHNRELGSA